MLSTTDLSEETKNQVLAAYQAALPAWPAGPSLTGSVACAIACLVSHVAEGLSGSFLNPGRGGLCQTGLFPPL